MSDQKRSSLLQNKLRKIKRVKAAIIVFTLILVIIFSAVWVSHGLDYALGFIVALGLVVFVGMPLFERYTKQESVVRREIHQLKEDNQ